MSFLGYDSLLDRRSLCTSQLNITVEYVVRNKDAITIIYSIKEIYKSETGSAADSVLLRMMVLIYGHRPHATGHDLLNFSHQKTL